MLEWLFKKGFRTINFHFRDENSINYPNSAQSWHCTTNWLDVCITQRNKGLTNCTTNTTYFGLPPPFITTKTPHCSQRLFLAVVLHPIIRPPSKALPFWNTMAGVMVVTGYVISIGFKPSF
ncbi:hypothetical protein CEXT_183971 [Caerostris extrusa]|uniref:Uncharacterized protein n=1 Tax=Caerostris extrusa TaxID=172846 RepID=A0AAV4XP65_CAEEX|nr:hypothetical protein CEXT_183971 [Caerostris extrusa]